MCEKLGVLEELKRYNGVMVGFSAGAMLMSKYIIITPCSEKYPDFHIEEGLNFDGLSRNIICWKRNISKRRLIKSG